MTGDPCPIEGCNRPIRAKGFCVSHYRRNELYGDPLGKPAPREKKPRETYADRIKRNWHERDRNRWRTSQLGRGVCPVCSRRDIALRPDGTLRWHAPRLGLGRVECAGTSAYPAVTRSVA